MSANFQFSWNGSWGNKKLGEKRKLSPQEEYWLDRILRDHGKQIFVVITLFLLVLAGAIAVAVVNGGVAEGGMSYSVIEIKGGK